MKGRRSKRIRLEEPELSQEVTSGPLKSIFGIGPIAKTIVSHLEPEDFINCFEVCSDWNAALSQPFLWNQAYFSATKYMIKDVIELTKRKPPFPEWFKNKKCDAKYIRSREKFWYEMPKEKGKLSLQDTKLLVFLVASYQKYRKSSNHEDLEEEVHEFTDCILAFPSGLYDTASATNDEKFFKFHLDLIDEVEDIDRDIDEECIQFTKVCLQAALIAAGNGKKWHIIAEFIQKLPEEAFNECDNYIDDFQKPIGDMPNTLLERAAGWGNLKIFNLILTRVPTAHLMHCNAVTRAAGFGHFELVKMIVGMMPRKTLDMVDEWDQTPLHVAVEAGRVEIAQFLISKMTKNALMIDDMGQKTALHYAAEYGHLEIVKALISKMPKRGLMMRDNTQRTALFLAVKEGHLEIVRELAGKITNLMEDIDALHLAAEDGNLEITKVLVHLMPDYALKMPDSDQKIALQLAADTGHLETVHFLVTRMLLVAKKYARRLAAEDGSLEIVKVLVDLMPDEALKKQGPDQKTALQLAADKGHLETVHFLVTKMLKKY